MLKVFAKNCRKINNSILLFKRHISKATGNIIVSSRLNGFDHLRDSRLNKGLGFTFEERQLLGLQGLQPPTYRTQAEQVAILKIIINRYNDPLNKFLHLMDTQETNERLFYRYVSENLQETMPIIFTPTVGLACQRFGIIYRRPRGLFITYNDRGHIFDVLRSWPEPNVRVVCVTDGESILGLGDLGANGMGIPVGKLSLATAIGGLKPHKCLPIQLDIGTNNQELLDDPYYVGLRQERIRGRDYEDFVEEFMKATVDRYGPATLIQFEDFGKENSFNFLKKFRRSFCTLNDDIQCTAAVTTACLLAAKRSTNMKPTSLVYVVVGAGTAGCGIANMIVQLMLNDGMDIKEALERIWLVDKQGLLVKSGELKEQQKIYAKDSEPIPNLVDVIKLIKPNVLIGVSAVGGLFTGEILRIMAANNDRPIIMALSNPTPQAECTPVDAYQHTEGRCFYVSGSPFPPIQIEEKVIQTAQGNHSYLFPGMTLGIIASRTLHISDKAFLVAAKELANCVDDTDLANGNLLPPLSLMPEISFRVAKAVAKYAFESGVALLQPEPADYDKWLKSKLYDYNYDCSVPVTWSWPQVEQPVPIKELTAPEQERIEPIKVTIPQKAIPAGDDGDKKTEGEGKEGKEDTTKPPEKK